MRRLGLIGVLVLTVTFLGACGTTTGPAPLPHHRRGDDHGGHHHDRGHYHHHRGHHHGAPDHHDHYPPRRCPPVVGLSWRRCSRGQGPRLPTGSPASTGQPSTCRLHRDRGGVAGRHLGRLVVGTPEPGNDAIAVYFDRSDPWVFKVKGIETFAAGPPRAGDGGVVPGAAGLRRQCAARPGHGRREGDHPGVARRGSHPDASYQWRCRPGRGDRGAGRTLAHRPPAGHHWWRLPGRGTFSLEMWLHPEQFLVRPPTSRPSSCWNWPPLGVTGGVVGRGVRACAEVLPALREVLGDRLSTSADERRHHGSDEGWQPPVARRRWPSPSPRRGGRLVSICASARVPVIPFGAGTSSRAGWPPSTAALPGPLRHGAHPGGQRGRPRLHRGGGGAPGRARGLPRAAGALLPVDPEPTPPSGHGGHGCLRTMTVGYGTMRMPSWR